MSSGYTPADPLFVAQWHLRNVGQAIMGLPQDARETTYRNDINVTDVWPDYTAGASWSASTTTAFSSNIRISPPTW